MQTMMIHAASAESAREILAALSPFEAKLVDMGDKHMVVVDLRRDAQIVGVLNALQQYVTERGDGAAQLDFNGQRYVMRPEPERPARSEERRVGKGGEQRG